MVQNEPAEVSILVVDDDEVDVRGLQRALRKRRVSNPIYVAENGRVALDLLSQPRQSRLSKPYIVLLDINMPVMNGLEFLRHLRAEPDLSDTIVFVLTTSDHERDIASAFENHIAGYLLKDRVGDDFTDLISLLEYMTSACLFPQARNASGIG